MLPPRFNNSILTTTTAATLPPTSNSGDGLPSSASTLPYISAGGIAGTAVDLSLYPLDTLKTRLQSSGGFFANGGWSGVYKGVGSVIAGSAPGAALFFVTYEATKSALARSRQSHGKDTVGMAAAGDHMLAATLGEIAACTVRVPTEVVKQRAQASQFSSSWMALSNIFTSNRGLGRVWMELYRGWGITVMREIPFTVIQFPLWEAMKRWRSVRKGRNVNAVESALFGSLSGCVAAAATTPLDVLKTRLMLAKKKEPVLSILRNIVKEEGTRGLFKGIGPRAIWISVGGAIFLGAWDFAKGALENL